MNVRETALKTLYEIFYNGAYSNLALKEAMKNNAAMSPQDKRLLTNLVYGVVSRSFTLEYIISQYSRVKPKKIAKYVMIILKLGIYQLVYTDKIPQSAAVNESVKLAKKFGRNGSDKFVNGVLRSFCRDNCEIEYPKDKKEYLAVRYSYSDEMTELFIKHFGYENAEKLMSSLNSPPPLMIRVNILKTNIEDLEKEFERSGIKYERVAPTMLSVHGLDVGASELYKNGSFSVQDFGAYSASLSLEPKSGETIIDMCAAPGGKSTHIAELMGDKGKIIAFDIHDHKIKLIESAAERLGISSIKAVLHDSTAVIEELRGCADRVLCDVPCSGWGIIRRKPDIKLSKNDVSALPELQLEILRNGAQYLKDGGTLVYSTCTIDPDENDGVISQFLNENNNFEKVYEKTYYPYIDNSDGFYICKLKKI